jgi:5'-nucleotidase
MIVLIDMDDVLADFDGEVYTRWKKMYPDKHIVPPGERTRFYLHEEMPDGSRDILREINTSKGFIRNLPEVPGSIEAVKEIAELGHTVFICTAPLLKYKNCVPEKYEWIEEHLGKKWIERLILTRDKTMVRGDILIDDKPEITGVNLPVWEHVIYDKAYNSGIKNQRRITWKNWKEILIELINK